MYYVIRSATFQVYDDNEPEAIGLNGKDEHGKSSTFLEEEEASADTNKADPEFYYCAVNGYKDHEQLGSRWTLQDAQALMGFGGRMKHLVEV